MKTSFGTRPVIPLIILLALVTVGRLTAQTFTTLYSFTATSDGAWPFAGLFISGNNVYGVAGGGGSSGNGTVFRMNTNGTGFAVLHDFTALSNLYSGTNNDGAFPNSLVCSGSTLYGTAAAGGASGNGVVFALNADGTDFRVVYNFTPLHLCFFPIRGLGLLTNIDGSSPHSLVLSGNTLYGTAQAGGSSASGTVFKLNTDGSGFAPLWSFTVLSPFYPGTSSSYPLTNNDGAFPTEGLLLSGDTLYGTAQQGGAAGNGSVFKLKIDGTSFTNLHDFSVLDPLTNTNYDGWQPAFGVTLAGNTLYGTTSGGGPHVHGTVFALNIDGTSFETLYDVAYGRSPGSLLVSGSALYSTEVYGGVFKINTDGTDFAVLHEFTTTSDGERPDALTLSGNIFYGAHGNAVFSIALPVLTITPSAQNIILSWPTNDASFVLQSATNLPGVWTTNLPAPVIINGQYTVTKTISGTQQFFRLSSSQ